MREPCEGAPIALAVEPDVFAASQTGALSTCERKRQQGVSEVDIHNKYAAALAEDRQRVDCLATRGFRVWRRC